MRYRLIVVCLVPVALAACGETVDVDVPSAEANVVVPTEALAPEVTLEPEAVRIVDFVRADREVEIGVVGMHQLRHLAEAQHLIARFEPQKTEHRARPVDAPACQIPVPQAAASA